MAFDFKRLLARGPEVIKAEHVLIKEIPLEEMGLTFLYVVVASLWFVFADEVFDRVMDLPVHSPAIETMKGINFVLTTGFVLYLVLRRTVRTRRLAEEALRLSQQRFEFVALATTDAIWDLNMETKVIWWSDGMQELFGYKASEISNNLEWWVERLHPDDRERVMAEIRRVGDSGGKTWSGHYRFRRSDGSYAVVLDRGYIIRDAAGKPARVVGGISDITERRRAEEALESSRRQLRGLSARLQSAREGERGSVARQIHDELGQVLTAIKMNLDWIERKIGEHENDPSFNPMLERIVESVEMIDTGIETVQRISTDLRPGSLDTLGLAEALKQEAERFQKRSGISCELQLPADTLDLPPDACTAIFRIFQEALTNVARHAKAGVTRIELQTGPEKVTLQIEDNGCGIKSQAMVDPHSLGLLGMRERAAVLGGELAIAPITPSGTRVTLNLPRAANDKQFWADL